MGGGSGVGGKGGGVEAISAVLHTGLVTYSLTLIFTLSLT